MELKGQLAAAGNQISLQNPEQGAMAGNVVSKGPNEWQFTMAGAPASQPPLTFARAARSF